MMPLQRLLRHCELPFERLIVGVCDAPKRISKKISSADKSFLLLGSNIEPYLGNIGALAVKQLLLNCRVPPADVHDTSDTLTHDSDRDVHGLRRQEAFFLQLNGGDRANGFEKRMGGRSANASPFFNYNGLFCDRLLCGASPPVRTAAFIPYVGRYQFDFVLTPLLLQQRQIDACDICAAIPNSSLPLGQLYLSTLRGSLDAGLVNMQDSGPLLRSFVKTCFERFSNFEAALDMSVLSIGVGNTYSKSVITRGTFSDFCKNDLIIHEESFRYIDNNTLPLINSIVIPRAAFSLAYWVTHPAHAAKFAKQKINDDLIKNSDKAMLSRLQQSLPSTRDVAIIRAFIEGRDVDRSLRHQDLERHVAKILRIWGADH